MEKNYFKTLDASSQTELTWNYGEIVTSFETADYYLSLYVLDAFFVELHIHKHSNELESIVLQEDRDILYAYLRELDISDAWQ